MKKKFSVELFYEIEYEIEAKDEDEAIEQAVERWKNTFPNVIIKPAKEEGKEDSICDICVHYYRDEDEEFPQCHYGRNGECVFR